MSDFMRTASVASISFALNFLASMPSHAAGDLDTTFGSNGVLISSTSSGNGNFWSAGHTQSSDSSLLITGQFNGNLYSANVLNNSFSVSPHAINNSSGGVPTATGDYLRADTSSYAVAVGNCSSGQTQPATTLTINKKSESNVVLSSYSNTSDGLSHFFHPRSIQVETDGSFTLPVTQVIRAYTASCAVGTTWRMGALRLSSALQPIAAFGGDSGFALASTPSGFDEIQAYATRTLPDGRVYVAGEARNIANRTSTLVLARFTAAGALDTTFAAAGLLVTSMSNVTSNGASSNYGPYSCGGNDPHQLTGGCNYTQFIRPNDILILSDNSVIVGGQRQIEANGENNGAPTFNGIDSPAVPFLVKINVSADTGLGTEDTAFGNQVAKLAFSSVASRSGEARRVVGGGQAGAILMLNRDRLFAIDINGFAVTGFNTNSSSVATLNGTSSSWNDIILTPNNAGALVIGGGDACPVNGGGIPVGMANNKAIVARFNLNTANSDASAPTGNINGSNNCPAAATTEGSCADASSCGMTTSNGQSATTTINKGSFNTAGGSAPATVNNGYYTRASLGLSGDQSFTQAFAAQTFKIGGLSTTGIPDTVTVKATFPTAVNKLLKCTVDGSGLLTCQNYPIDSGAGTTTITYTLTDNGAGDQDATRGTITDPFMAGTVTAADAKKAGALDWLSVCMLGLFGLAASHRRRPFSRL